MDPSSMQRGKMNAELMTGETQPYLTHGEKKAMKEAEKAEKAFRASKGYEPDTFWARLKKKFRK